MPKLDIASYLKLPPIKLHCSMLAEDGIKKAIDDYRKKNPNAKFSVETSSAAKDSGKEPESHA